MHLILNKPAQSEAVLKALDFARQVRTANHKASDHSLLVPYDHSTEMVEEAADIGLPESLLIVAALHDVLENAYCSAEQISEHFGKEIAGLLSQFSLTQNEIRDWDNLEMEIYATRLQHAPVELQSLKLLDWTQTLMHLCDKKSPRLIGYAKQVANVLQYLPDSSITLQVRCTSAIRWAYRGCKA